MWIRVLVSALALVLAGAVLSEASLGAPEQTVTITIRDSSYHPDSITVEAGVPVVLTLLNRGKVVHEFSVYDTPKTTNFDLLLSWAERTGYFRGLKVDVSGGKVILAAGDVVRIRVAAGQTATVAFTPFRKGTFEMACLIEDHYQVGHRGVFIVK